VTTTYTLTVKGPGGVSMRSTTVVVATTPPAMVSTLTGTGQPGSTDGAPGVATFSKPFAVAVMPHANSTGSALGTATTALSYDIFILDSNHTIRRVSPDGMTTTFAGIAGVRGTKNGFRTDATFDFSNFAGAITASSDGTFDVVDANGLQRRIDSAGNVTNLCASCARFPLPGGVVRLADRTTYISDAGNHTITRVSPAGATTVIGRTGQPGFRDGSADQAQFNRPRGLTVDAFNNVYVLDTGNNAIRRISTTNVVATVTIAGNASSGGDLILGCCASGIVAAPGGGLFITDPGSNTIKQIRADGSITTVAGSGNAGSTNGSGSNASFNGPLGIAFAPDGSLVVADTENNTVRSVQPPPVSSSHPRIVQH
jgi:streptogramin lyase